MKHRILVINPGSTSTKIAVFEGKEKLFDTTLRYSTEGLASFGWVMEQVDFHRATIEKALADNHIDPDSLDAICARGGQVPYGSCRLFVDGRMVDCVRDDEWMFAPERFGGAAMQDVVTLCYSGKYTESEMMGFVRGKGGLVAHLGTSNAIEVEKRIEEGDSHAKLVYDGMLYSNVRAIGALAAAADGKIDRIILTGGLAHSKYVAAYITKKVSFIAPVEVMAGEFELEALAAGACRVLDGEEKAKDFSKLLEKA